MAFDSDIQIIHRTSEGFESDSVEGSIPRRSWDRHQRALMKPPKEPYKVNGEVPDVVHVLEYINTWNNATIGTRVSANAFKKIPEKYDDDQNSGEGDDEPEMPVLEVLTQVFTSHGVTNEKSNSRTRSRRHRRRGNPDYTSSDCSDDEPDPARQGPDTSEPILKIHSAHLRNAIRATVAYYPYARLTRKTLSIPSPYRALYHHREELARYRGNQPASHSAEDAAITSKHIDVLLSFLEEANGKDIRREEDRHRRQVPMATYEYFWLLLKPGEIVYAKRSDIWTPYVVSSVSVPDDSQDSSDCYTIKVWHLESNGSKVKRIMDSFQVAPWLGEQAISSLSVVPARFWKEDLAAQGGMTMQDKCIAEGKLYWDLLKGPAYMEYDGLLVNSESGNKLPNGPIGFMCGRVVCDAAGYRKFFQQHPDMAPPPPMPTGRYHGRRPPIPIAASPVKDHLPKSLPRCPCETCMDSAEGGLIDSPYVGFEDLDPEHDAPPDSNLFYFVLSNVIPGFILGQRRWGHLNLEHLRPVKTDKEAFKYLVLDDDVKLTVKALIGKFAAATDAPVTPWATDIVKNKGEGRIFLLHGDPGVGKTCTAECIAELTNRPLISLTSGDLSVNTYRVESSLSYFLELGHRYGALVLLDEADVYLERRRSKDIARNGLVSVFLRALEYYRGVLFLTTNRVQSFDNAFLSRIHVALHYPNLTDEDRERIWANNFERLDRDSGGQVRVSAPAREYVWTSRDVRRLRWNGREIRNAMQTALALAENEAAEDGLGTGRATITEKHMRAVVKISAGFRDFIRTSISPADGGLDSATDDDEPVPYDSEGEYSE